MIPQRVIDAMKDLGVFPVVLCTVDKEGNPHLTFITWVYPTNDRTLKMALSSNAKSAKNILETGRVSLMVFYADTAVALYGKAKMALDRIEDVKFPVSVFEMSVEKVEDVLFPGGTVTGPIPFAHTGDLLKAAELDEMVLSSLRK
ncbi:pyridoxamine 5'-phosphate oxidase family protein [Thermocrinis sp.]